MAAEPRLVITAILAGSRSRSRSLYRSPGTPIGKSIDYLDFATIKLPAPAYYSNAGQIAAIGMPQRMDTEISKAYGVSQFRDVVAPSLRGKRRFDQTLH